MSSSIFRRSSGLPEVRSITETINLAFSTDPTWSPILIQGNDLSQAEKYWAFFVNSAARFPWSFTTDEAAAVSVWFPPRAEELTPQEEAYFPEFVADLLGKSRTEELFRVLAEFDKATPTGDYFYLSLLAVHPNHAGKGLGMQLLRENLAEIDALGYPSFLESSNPKNNVKYESLGYKKYGKIELPSGLTLATYWRDPKV